MTSSIDRRQAARESLSRWRAKTSAQKRRVRHEVIASRVINSMAMENEPVSAAWIQQAKTKRTA